MARSTLSLLAPVALLVALVLTGKGASHFIEGTPAAAIAALTELNFAMQAWIVFAICAVGLALFEIDRGRASH